MRWLSTVFVSYSFNEVRRSDRSWGVFLSMRERQKCKNIFLLVFPPIHLSLPHTQARLYCTCTVSQKKTVLNKCVMICTCSDVFGVGFCLYLTVQRLHTDHPNVAFPVPTLIIILLLIQAFFFNCTSTRRQLHPSLWFWALLYNPFTFWHTS